MPVDFAKKYFNTLWPIELYKFTSFLTSSLLWCILYYNEPNFFSHAHFISLLTLGNAIMYFNTRELSHLHRSGTELPAYFLFQFISFIGMSYAHGQNEYIYMSMFPAMMSMYFFTFVSTSKESIAQKKSLFVYTVLFCSMILFESYKKGEFFNEGELISFMAFTFWALSTVFWGLEQYLKGRKIIFSKLLSISSDEHKISSSRHDRIFFHDVINHTHSMLLFLRTKKDNGIDQTEVNNLIGELKLLQENIQHHFGFKHKDLISSKKDVPFQIALARVYGLIDAFFTHGEEIFISLKGEISDQENSDTLRNCTVNIILFHQIMTNIIKNVYEAQSSRVEFIFDYQADGLHTTVINEPKKLNHEKINLDKDLGRVILDLGARQRSGLGLDSISRICEEVGGDFSFSFSEGHWHTYFFIPHDNAVLNNTAKKSA